MTDQSVTLFCLKMHTCNGVSLIKKKISVGFTGYKDNMNYFIKMKLICTCFSTWFKMMKTPGCFFTVTFTQMVLL